MSEVIHHGRALGWLEAASYAVRFREDAWVECLVVREKERWLGRGTDRESALADVVWQMLPSHAARVLAALEGVIVEGPVEDDDAEPEGRAAEPASEPAAAAPTPPESAAQAVREPSPPPPPEVATAPAAAAELVEVVAPVEPEPVPAPTDEAIDAALAELMVLEERIDAAREAVGLMAPQLQRAHILAWACRARALQDTAPDEYELHSATARVVRSLGLLCKLWWPGSVRAL